MTTKLFPDKKAIVFPATRPVRHRRSRSEISIRRASRRLPNVSSILTLCAVIALVVAPIPQISAAKPTATAVVTDQTNLKLSNQFGPPNQFILTNAGDVLFTSGSNTALFRWSGGVNTRLLQTADSHPGFANSTIEDFVAANLVVNALGHAAMTNLFVQKGVRPTRGVFVYDGTNFEKVALGGAVAPGSGGNTFFNFNQLQINDSDQVAFRARLEPIAIGPLGLFIGSPTTAPIKIALPGDPAPSTGGGTFQNLQTIGLNNAGHVAFLSTIIGGTTNRALFLWTPSGISKVVAAGDAAPGTTGTFGGLNNNPANYFFNDSDEIAFTAGVAGGGATTVGIWVGSGSGPPTKLVVNDDATGASFGGDFGGGIRVRGLNNSGKVLFQSNPGSGATASHALFLKDVSTAAQVVFFQGQTAPGGTTEVFGFTQQALLNASGGVAFLARLSGGPSLLGWFLGSGTAAPIKIALQGDAAPAGGTFGLAGRNQAGRINSAGRVLFAADVIGPNQVGLFRFTPGGGITPVMGTNDALPSGANSFVNASTPGASNDALVFYAQKAGGRSNVFTKAFRGGGGPTRRAGEGDPAPGIGGVLWNIDPFAGLINNSEEVAFSANSIVGGSFYPAIGVFTNKPGVGTQKIAATGDAAPGGGTLDDAFLAETEPRINSLGQVAIAADISGVHVGLFVASVTGGLQKIARTGDASPFGPGTIVDFPLDITMNDFGQVAFGVTIQSGPVFTTALLVGSATSAPVKVVAQSDSSPAGGTVTGIGTFFRMNGTGQVAYRTDLTSGPAPSGIFIGTAGGAQSPVAVSGASAPGTGAGTFLAFDDSMIEVNSSGEVAFFATIAGSAVTRGYFSGFGSGSPVARLLEGQALPGGGSVGVITALIGAMTLLDSAQVNIQVFNITGAPNLFRQVIISPAGAVSELETDGQKADGTGSSFGESVAAVPSTTQDRLVFSSVLVGGPAKFGIFSN